MLHSPDKLKGPEIIKPFQNLFAIENLTPSLAAAGLSSLSSILSTRPSLFTIQEIALITESLTKSFRFESVSQQLDDSANLQLINCSCRLAVHPLHYKQTTQSIISILSLLYRCSSGRKVSLAVKDMSRSAISQIVSSLYQSAPKLTEIAENQALHSDIALDFTVLFHVFVFVADLCLLTPQVSLSTIGAKSSFRIEGNRNLHWLSRVKPEWWPILAKYSHQQSLPRATDSTSLFAEISEPHPHVHDYWNCYILNEGRPMTPIGWYDYPRSTPVPTDTQFGLSLLIIILTEWGRSLNQIEHPLVTMIIEECIRIILLLSVPTPPPPPFTQSQSLQLPYPSSISSNNVAISIVSSYFGVPLPASTLFTTMHLLAVLLIVAPRHVQPYTSLLFTRIFNSLLIDSSSFLASVPTAFELTSLSATALLAPSPLNEWITSTSAALPSQSPFSFLPTIHQRSVVLNVFLIIAKNKEFIASLFPLTDASLTSSPVFTRLCRILSDLVFDPIGTYCTYYNSQTRTEADNASRSLSSTPFKEPSVSPSSQTSISMSDKDALDTVSLTSKQNRLSPPSSLPRETSNPPCINTPLEWLLPLPQEHFSSDPIQDLLKTEREPYVFSLPTKYPAFIPALSASFAFSATPDQIRSFSASALRVLSALNTTIGEVFADVKKEDKVEDCDLAAWRTHFSVVADLKEQIKIASSIFTTLSPKEAFQHLVEKNIFQLDFDELPPPKLRSLPDASPATPEEPPAPPKKTYSPRSVAVFLRIAALDTETVGEYLCINKPFNKLVLKEYYNLLDLSPLTLDEALRVMMTSFRASGEGQVMDRLMDILGEIIEPTFRKGDEERRKKQEEANEPLDREITVDDAYVAGFTLTLLNSNRHNVNVGQKEKMSLDKFIEQVYKIGNKEVFTVDVLERLFTSIELNPFIPLQSTPAPVFEPVVFQSLTHTLQQFQVPSLPCTLPSALVPSFCPQSFVILCSNLIPLAHSILCHPSTNQLHPIVIELLNSLADNAAAMQIGTVVDDILHLLWSVVAHLSGLPNDFILPLPHFGLLKSTAADVEKGESTAQNRSSKFIQAAYASALRNPFTYPTPSENRKIISNNHLLSTIVQLFSIANKNIVLVECGWAEIATSFYFLFSLGLISPEMLASVISPSQNNLKDHINPQSSIASPASDRIRHAPTVASPGTTAQQLPPSQPNQRRSGLTGLFGGRQQSQIDQVVKQEDALRAARATFSASDLSELLRTVRSLTAEHQEIFVLTLITSLFHVTLPVLSRKEDTNTSSEAGEEVKLTPVNNHIDPFGLSSVLNSTQENTLLMIVDILLFIVCEPAKNNQDRSFTTYSHVDETLEESEKTRTSELIFSHVFSALFPIAVSPHFNPSCSVRLADHLLSNLHNALSISSVSSGCFTLLAHLLDPHRLPHVLSAELERISNTLWWDLCNCKISSNAWNSLLHVINNLSTVKSIASLVFSILSTAIQQIPKVPLLRCLKSFTRLTVYEQIEEQTCAMISSFFSGYFTGDTDLKLEDDRVKEEGVVESWYFPPPKESRKTPECDGCLSVNSFLPSPNSVRKFLLDFVVTNVPSASESSLVALLNNTRPHLWTPCLCENVKDTLHSKSALLQHASMLCLVNLAGLCFGRRASLRSTARKAVETGMVELSTAWKNAKDKGKTAESAFFSKLTCGLFHDVIIPLVFAAVRPPNCSVHIPLPIVHPAADAESAAPVLKGFPLSSSRHSTSSPNSSPLDVDYYSNLLSLSNLIIRSVPLFFISSGSFLSSQWRPTSTQSSSFSLPSWPSVPL
ncbi:hypothetical protein BLNAU_11907 [Blattamonas nauphoetae]|uniref:SEC7 domain-containing protein n=1 Tax=Blattamonas nauphoetae TaxID=2049346 RepID=A0ABQ9XL12_9EUKA|nr:hypothetical protein BLNAU_11907 [Blattamonas nauphoetae]